MEGGREGGKVGGRDTHMMVRRNGYFLNTAIVLACGCDDGKVHLFAPTPTTSSKVCVCVCMCEPVY